MFLSGKVFADITKFQGHFVQGPESTVVKAAVSAITACASRLVSKKTRASALLSFERTHTSGKEVAEWLASYKLAHYTSTLDRLRLDTLRKISDMTSDDVLKVHQTFLAQNADLMQYDVGHQVCILPGHTSQSGGWMDNQVCMHVRV